MYRLYSRFPGGAVGVGLLLLRLTVAGGLVQSAFALFDSNRVFLPVSLLLVLGAAFTGAGVRTSAACLVGSGCALVALVHDWGLLRHSLQTSIWLSGMMLPLAAGSLALIGPGSYSVDARLAGWREFQLSAGSDETRNSDD